MIFDKDYKAQQFYWLPEDCANQATSPAAPAVVAANPIINEKINLSADALFAFDKFKPEDMLSQGRQSLDALAQKLVGYQQQGRTQVMITGHTDYLGEDMYNMNLSLLRAQTVRSYLIAHGVDANVIMATGAGESQPIKQCSSQLPHQALIQCLQPNRRVEASVSVFK